MSMPTGWDAEFSERMLSFEASTRTRGPSVSIKVRVTGGCFHRECSPRAFVLIDKELTEKPTGGSPLKVVEHESGPEILTFVTDGLTIAASVVTIVVAILQAPGLGYVRVTDRLSHSS